VDHQPKHRPAVLSGTRVEAYRTSFPKRAEWQSKWPIAEAIYALSGPGASWIACTPSWSPESPRTKCIEVQAQVKYANQFCSAGEDNGE